MSDYESFALVPQESAVLIETRSNVGPIVFGTLSVEGTAALSIDTTDLDETAALSASMRIPVASLASGNTLYDSELRDRLEQRRYPWITVEMISSQPLGSGRFGAEGDVTIHGSTRRLSGTLSLTMPDANTVVAQGQHVVDIRDFAIRLPSMLMLKIYPDVSVQFRITAVRAATAEKDI